MKTRLILPLCIFAITTNLVFSQPLVIPRIGLSISRTNSLGLEGLEQVSKVGLSAGVAVELTINKIFALLPELNYTQKGFGFTTQASDQGFSLSIDNKTRIDYLEMPLLAKIYIKPGSNIYFLTGPSVAIGLGGQSKSKLQTDLFGTPFSITVKGKVKFGDPPASYNPEEDAEVYFNNRVDFGIQGGLGIVLYRKASLEFRYYYGLSHLQKDEDSQNRAVYLSVTLPLTMFTKNLN